MRVLRSEYSHRLTTSQHSTSHLQTPPLFLFPRAKTRRANKPSRHHSRQSTASWGGKRTSLFFNIHHFYQPASRGLGSFPFVYYYTHEVKRHKLKEKEKKKRNSRKFLRSHPSLSAPCASLAPTLFAFLLDYFCCVAFLLLFSFFLFFAFVTY